MPKPSLVQTLLRRPSRTYSTLGQGEQGTAKRDKAWAAQASNTASRSLRDTSESTYYDSTLDGMDRDGAGGSTYVHAVGGRSSRSPSRRRVSSSTATETSIALSPTSSSFFEKEDYFGGAFSVLLVGAQGLLLGQAGDDSCCTCSEHGFGELDVQLCELARIIGRSARPTRPPHLCQTDAILQLHDLRTSGSGSYFTISTVGHPSSMTAPLQRNIALDEAAHLGHVSSSPCRVPSPVSSNRSADHLDHPGPAPDYRFADRQSGAERRSPCSDPDVHASRLILAGPAIVQVTLPPDQQYGAHLLPRVVARDDSPDSKSSGEDGDSQDDTFYTPPSSPRTSPRTSMLSSPEYFASTLDLPTRRPSASHPAFNARSDDSDSVHSSDSSCLHSTSTHVASPGGSEGGDGDSYTTTITIASSDTASRYPVFADVPDDSQKWAKDVRWLTSPFKVTSSPVPAHLYPLASRSTHLQSMPQLPTKCHPAIRRHSSSRSRSDRVYDSRQHMAPVFEDDEDEASPCPDRPPSYASDAVSVSPSGQKQYYSSGPTPAMPLPAHTHARSASTASGTSDLPTPLPAMGGGAGTYGGGGAAYTTLVLPRANYVPSAHAAGRLASGRVDLTRSGLAQTTMATVEVLRGMAGQARPRRAFSIRRRGGSETGWGKSRFVELVGERSGEAVGEEADALVFTSHVPPPTYVPAASILVQVCAVGLNGMDEMLVRERIGEKGKGGAVGFVPGRSFVGRAVECGSEVDDEAVRRGDWVIGLLDIHKCGALAEFVVINRRRVHKVPRPAPLASGSQIRGATLEELALLPLSGVAAYRGVRTFEQERLGSRGLSPRVLVLQGQDGAGAMAVQMLWARGMRVCVQLPYGGGLVPDTAHADADAKQTHELAAVARARACGAEEVCAGPPLAVLEQLRRRGDRFDFVLDTVGGRAVWEASRALLAAPELESGEEGGAEGRQFTTLVGDAPERPLPTVQDHFWAGMRSLGIWRGKVHGMGRSTGDGNVSATGGGEDAKEGRGAGYAWVSAAADVDWEGEDVRDSLAAVVRMVQNGTLTPCVNAKSDSAVMPNKVVPFEQTAQVFRDGAGRLSDGRTIVVKIVD